MNPLGPPHPSFPLAFWDQLPQTARGAVIEMVMFCYKRQSGRLEVEVHEGGVRELRRTVSVRGEALGKQDDPR